MYDKDAGRKTFVEELYEQQDRNFPGGQWKQAKVPWTSAVSIPVQICLSVCVCV